MFYICRYDKKDTSRIQLTDIQLVSAMGPPGGGKNPVTSRFLRHFNIISITKFSDDTMIKIFGNIVNHYFRVSISMMISYCNRYAQSVFFCNCTKLILSFH